MVLYSYKKHIPQRKTKLSGKTNLGGIYIFHMVNQTCVELLIGLSGNKTFTVKKRLCDENGQILILETLIDDSDFILINLYNANTESEKIKTLNELNTLLSNSDLSSEKHIIFAVNFNLFLDCSLDAKGVSPSLKKTLFK